MVTANLVFVLFSALAVLGMVVRVPSEEQMMIEQFGSEYETYMQHTGRFLPR
jgi:protein-S-isoprenylcysteine O-methyltransferase Ste14